MVPFDFLWWLSRQSVAQNDVFGYFHAAHSCMDACRYAGSDGVTQCMLVTRCMRWFRNAGMRIDVMLIGHMHIMMLLIRMRYYHAMRYIGS